MVVKQRAIRHLRVADIAALTQLSGMENGDIVETRGAVTAGIGAGRYRYDATDSSSTLDGGHVHPAANGNRWHLVDKSVVNVSHFGAVGDGSTDDTAGIQAAINATPTYGGVVYFPAGKYKITAAVTIPPRWHLTLRGDGFGPYTDANTPATDATKGTLFILTAAASGFLITRNASTAHRGLFFQNFGIRGVDNTYVPTAAFTMDTNGQTTFCRQFTWYRVACTYAKTFCLFKDSGASADKAWGVMKWLECSLQNNKSLIRTDNGTRINHCVFENNDAGANVDSGLTVRTGAIQVTGSGIMIRNNVMEGTNNPIYLPNCDNGITVTKNHFEACTGDWLVKIEHPDKCAIDVEDNLWPTTLDSTLTKHVWIQGNNSSTNAGARGLIRASGMIFPQSCFLTHEAVDALMRDDQFPKGTTDEINFVCLPDERWLHRPNCDQIYLPPVSTNYLDLVPSPFSSDKYVNGIAERSTTSFKDIFGQLTFASGDWVFCSYLVRRLTANTTNPNLKTNFALYYSASPTTGPRPLLYSFDKSTFAGKRLDNKWVMCVHGWKATATNNAGNNVRAQVIPYNQVNGDFDLTGFCFYKCSDPNEFRPWIPLSTMAYASTKAVGGMGAAETFVIQPGVTFSGLLDTADCTFTFTAPSQACEFQILVAQDGTGSRTITWPTIQWQGGTAKQPQAAAASVTIYRFFYSGSAYYEIATNKA